MAIFTITTILIILFTVIIACLLVTAFLIFDELKHNYAVRIKEVVNGRLLIRRTKAKEVKDKDGTTWLKFKKHIKERRPLPPSECIDLQQNFFRTVKAIDAYLLENGNLRYAKDEYRFMSGYKPITTEDRAALITQIEKANNEAGKVDWQKVQTVISVFVIIIIILFGYFTFQDFNEKQVEIAGMGVKMTENIKEAAQYNADALNGVQRLRAETPTTPESTVNLGDENVYNN